MLVRREKPADRSAIFDVHAAAFATDDVAPASEATLVDDLRAAGDVIPALSLVAELDGQVVGHVLVSRARLGGQASLGLAPVGVLPSHQKAGVGSALMHAVLAAADALEFPEVVLLGDPAYYQRFGFRLARTLDVIPPDPRWAPYFQVRTLSSWNDQRVGSFRYAEAFGVA